MCELVESVHPLMDFKFLIKAHKRKPISIRILQARLPLLAVALPVS